MVSNLSILTCLVTLFLSLMLPILALVLYLLKNRKQGIFSAWLLGAAGFAVTQLCIRVPILNVLSGQGWFLSFSQNHLFGYAFSLAFTAGLFELAGRYAAAMLMRNHLTWKRSLAAGLGHGGIEAIVLVGVTYINNLLYIAMINSGTFELVIAQTAASGVDPLPLYSIQQALISTPPALFLLAGFERLLTMTAHTAMSVLICYGIAHQKRLPCILLCLGIHTLIDLTAGISLLSGTMLSQTAAYTLIYSILTASAAVSVVILRKLRRNWQEELSSEVSNET